MKIQKSQLLGHNRQPIMSPLSDSKVFFINFTLMFLPAAVTQLISFKGELLLTFRTCNFDNGFKIYSGASLRDCILDCHLKRSCRDVIYRQSNGICVLTATDIDYDNLEEGLPVCVYTKPSHWNIKKLGQCTTNSCNERQLCNWNSTQDISNCSPSECPVPSSIGHATFKPVTRSIATKVAYFCDFGYTPRGNASITCLPNGTWTSTDFYCAPTCPRPMTVDNADIVDVSTSDYGNGSVLTISCKTGYINQNPTDITSTCKTDSWSYKIVPCCKPGYTFSWDSRGESCYRIHDNVQLTTADEMAEYCTNESSTASLFFDNQINRNRQVSENIFNTTNTTLDYIMTSSRKSSMKNDLLNCIDESEVNIRKHKRKRKKDILRLLSGLDSDFDATGLSYGNLSAALEAKDNATWQQHVEFRLEDVLSRLNLTSGFSVPSSPVYEQLYAELQNKSIDRAKFENRTYTELAYFIRNNSLLVPPCGALDHWSDGYPSSEYDCIVTGPASNFTLIDVPCNDTNSIPSSTVGFICWEAQRRIQN